MQLTESLPRPAAATRPHSLGRALGRYRAVLGAMLLFTLLPVGLYTVWVLHLTTAIPGPPWDNLEWLYKIWWVRESLFVEGRLPFFHPDVFVPYGYPAAQSEPMLTHFAWMLPVLLVGDEVLAFNFMLWSSFVITGLGTSLYVYDLTGRRAPALLAGVIFAFSPYRLHSMAAGWLPLMGTGWLPLALLCFERLRRGRSWTWGLLAGFFLLQVVLASWYYAYIIGLTCAGYLALRLWPWRRWRSRSLWLGLAACLVVVVLPTIPAALPVVQLTKTSVSWSLADVEKWAAGLEDFLYPNIYHPLWGRFFLARRAEIPSYPWYVPGFLFLGLVPLGLSAVALWQSRGRRLTRLWLLLGLAGAVLALGPTLHLLGQRVYLPVPDAVEALFSRAMYVLTGKLALNKTAYWQLERPGAIPVPLPGLLLYLFAPFASGMRTFYRFGLIAVFATSVLAAFGLAGLETRLTRPAGRALLAALLVGLVVFEFAAPTVPSGRSDAVAARTGTLEGWLAAQPPGAVMRLPLVTALNGPSLYRRRAHRQPIAYGHGSFYPPAWLRDAARVEGFPDDASLAQLRDWGVRYLLVGRHAFDDGWADTPGMSWSAVEQALAARRDLRFIGVFQDSTIWRGEQVSAVVRGALPVTPISQDEVWVYELIER